MYASSSSNTEKTYHGVNGTSYPLPCHTRRALFALARSLPHAGVGEGSGLSGRLPSHYTVSTAVVAIKHTSISDRWYSTPPGVLRGAER